MYRHTEIIENQFFLHIVVHVFMYSMNECCGCMLDFIYSRKIDLSVFVWVLLYHFGFFRLCKEYTIEHWRFCSQRKECASRLCGVRKERARRVHQSDNNSGEGSRLLNTLEEKLCRRSTKRHSHWELCRARVGGNWVGASMHRRTLCWVQREEY
jgi:hypothetical protein